MMGYTVDKRPVKAHSLTTITSGVNSTSLLVASSAANVTGMLTLSGGLRHGLEAGTTAANLVGYGISTITTSTGPKTYTLANPSGSGILKVVACIDDGSSESATVTCAAGGSFYSSASTVATLRKATFNGGNDSLMLISMSTVKWMIVGNEGTVALATT